MLVSLSYVIHVPLLTFQYLHACLVKDKSGQIVHKSKCPGKHSTCVQPQLIQVNGKTLTAFFCGKGQKGTTEKSHKVKNFKWPNRKSRNNKRTKM